VSDRRRTAIDRWDGFRGEQRAVIADAIIGIIADQPDHVPTVTDVADAVGISRKTYYKYFEDLSGAMVFAQQRALARLSEAGAVAPGTASNGRERLLGMFESSMLSALKQPELLRFLSFFDYSFRHRGLTSQQHVSYEASVRASLSDIFDAFAAGQVDGSIRDDLDPERTLFTMGHSVMGLVQRVMLADPRTLRELGAPAIRLELEVWRQFLTPTA